MYSEGSYNHQFGQGPRAPVPPPYQHRPPGPPPPPPPHFQQQAPPAAPPHSTQPRSLMYQHGPPPPPPVVRQVPPAGIANSGQSHLPPPPPPPPAVCGSAPLPHMYPTAQQNSQYPSQFGSQNLHLPLPPPPPLPSHGQTLHRAPVLPPPQRPGGVQGHKQIPPPPPPSSSNFSSSSTFGSFMHSTSENSHLPPLAPSKECAIFDLPPPPPKPTEEKVVRKIEDFCRCIAETGLGYEDVARQNESRNPEFEFLFGGPPGSDAAIAYEYFQWLKKKFILARKLDKWTSNSPGKSLEDASSKQQDHMQAACGCHSPADSDMEMEDDITQPDNEQGIDNSIADLSFACGLMHSEHGSKEQLHALQGTANSGSAKDLQALQSCSSGMEEEARIAREPKASNCEKSSTFQAGGQGPSNGFAAYEDDSAENDEEPSPAAVLPLAAVGAKSWHKDTRINWRRDIESKSMSHKAPEFSPDSHTEAKGAVVVAIEGADNKHNKHVGSQAGALEAQKKDSLGYGCVDVAFTGEVEMENDAKNVTSSSIPPKVDRFGRLVREGASDSDSDDVRYTGRRTGRGRSSSRSRSPPDRRRRRRSRSRSRSKRSPQRRRERSRSWSRSPISRRSRSRSPRNRNRSRSPTFRRGSERGSDSARRDKGHAPMCFDFLRGRCHRGASCRYLHHDSEKKGPRRHRSKQQHVDIPPGAKNSSTHEEIKHTSKKVSSNKHDNFKSQEMQFFQDKPGGSIGARTDGKIDPKMEGTVSAALQSISSCQDTRSMDLEITKPVSSRKIVHKVLETNIVIGEPEDPTTYIDDNCKEAMGSHKGMLFDISSHKPLGDADTFKSHCDDSQQTDNSSISESSPFRTSTTSPNKLAAFPNIVDAQHLPSQLPPSACSLSHGANAARKSHLPKDYNSMPQPSSGRVPGEIPAHMLPNQHSNFSVNSSWASLPPPPHLPQYDSTINARTLTTSVSPQFQQNYLPSRNDFGSQTISRPYPSELPIQSQIDGLHHQSYPPTQEPRQPVSDAKDFKLKPPPMYDVPSQQYGGPSSLREDSLPQVPMQGLNPSTSYAQGKSNPQPMPYGLQHSQPDSVYNRLGMVGSSSRYSMDILDNNQPSHLPDFGGSRSSSYHNPYASTFEHSLSSNFSTDIVRQEKNMSYSTRHDTSFSLSHAPVDGQHIGGVGSRQAITSPNSSKAVGQNFPSSGVDQYDPLFDSIEPSSNLSKKFDHVPKLESTDDSDAMLRLSGSSKPLNVEENNKTKDVEAVTLQAYMDNEECGETADAEVGTVENGSPTDPVDGANMTGGEIEIDQIKSPGKNTANKESRSMRLFKVAVAEFVKEVLKPSWRQGNMSKEAFKTIVKKTVDKVSGAMKGHQVPKSKAKIEQYIDTQQRKLTKLVMGYVDKYVKV